MTVLMIPTHYDLWEHNPELRYSSSILESGGNFSQHLGWTINLKHSVHGGRSTPGNAASLQVYQTHKFQDLMISNLACKGS